MKQYIPSVVAGFVTSVALNFPIAALIGGYLAFAYYVANVQYRSERYKFGSIDDYLLPFISFLFPPLAILIMLMEGKAYYIVKKDIKNVKASLGIKKKLVFHWPVTIENNEE